MTGNTPNFLKVLTLDEFITQVTDSINKQKETTNGFITTINGRINGLKSSNGSPLEISRLEGLLKLHTDNLAALNNMDINALAQERLDTQTKKINDINSKIT